MNLLGALTSLSRRSFLLQLHLIIQPDHSGLIGDRLTRFVKAVHKDALVVTVAIDLLHLEHLHMEGTVVELLGSPKVRHSSLQQRVDESFRTPVSQHASGVFTHPAKGCDRHHYRHAAIEGWHDDRSSPLIRIKVKHIALPSEFQDRPILGLPPKSSTSAEVSSQHPLSASQGWYLLESAAIDSFKVSDNAGIEIPSHLAWNCLLWVQSNSFRLRPQSSRLDDYPQVTYLSVASWCGLNARCIPFDII